MKSITVRRLQPGGVLRSRPLVQMAVALLPVARGRLHMCAAVEQQAMRG